MIRKITFTIFIVLSILVLLVSAESEKLGSHSVYIKTVDCHFGPIGCKAICNMFIGCQEEKRMKDEDGFGCWTHDFCYCDLQE